MSTNSTPARRCKATTKKGTRCTRVPWGELKVCLAHAPKEVRASRGFGGAQPESGRPAVPKPTEVMRQAVEAHVLRILKPHFDALGVTARLEPDGTVTMLEVEGGGAMLHGTSQRDGSIHMSEYPDLGARIGAAEKLLDRALGRPKQSVAVGGDGGGPILLRVGALLDPVAAGHAAELAGRLAIEATTEETG